MYCVSPVWIPNKGKDVIPTQHIIDGHFVEASGKLVRCRGCPACRINTTLQNTVRLVLEKKQWASKNCCFVTLTYDEAHLPEHNTLVKYHLQKFNKDVRAALAYEDKKLGRPPTRIRYYAVGEYGDESDRAHYHIAYFGLGANKESRKLFAEHWPNSSSYMLLENPKGVEQLDAGKMEYIAGYVQKKLGGKLAAEKYEEQGRIAPFSFSSVKLGLSSFLEKREQYERDGFIMYKGIKVPIPRPYVDLLDLKLPPHEFSDSPYREFLRKHNLISDEFDKRLLADSNRNQVDLYQAKIPYEFRDNMKKVLEARNNLFKRGSL